MMRISVGSLENSLNEMSLGGWGVMSEEVNSESSEFPEFRSSTLDGDT